jgi:hypothetical protein
MLGWKALGFTRNSQDDGYHEDDPRNRLVCWEENSLMSNEFHFKTARFANLGWLQLQKVSFVAWNLQAFTRETPSNKPLSLTDAA